MQKYPMKHMCDKQDEMMKCPSQLALSDHIGVSSSSLALSRPLPRKRVVERGRFTRLLSLTQVYWVYFTDVSGLRPKLENLQ